MFYRTLALFAAIALVVRADMVPTSPDGATIAKVGDELTTLWTKDTTGTWNDVTIQLMTGDNWQMVPVSTLETGVDATTLDSYTFTVPEVTPTSKIYFLQFTPNTGNATQVTWTTRFTIAGADGSTSTPTESTQPDGQSIPWGTGQLVGAATTGTGASNSSISAAASSISASASAIIASASSTMASAAESAASEVESVTSMASASGAMSSMRTSSQASSTRSVAAASATTSTAGNGAGHVQVTGLGVVGLVAGLVAFLA